MPALKKLLEPGRIGSLELKNRLLYSAMDESFHIEEQITQAFPEQTPFYEDDEAWLKRKQEENIPK